MSRSLNEQFQKSCTIWNKGTLGWNQKCQDFSREVVQFQKRNDYTFCRQLYCFDNLKNYKVAFTNLNGQRTHPMNKFTVFH